MRNEAEMMRLILEVAQQNDHIRAVIMNGSRANPNAKPDCFQDYDIVYVVDDIETFTSDHSWVDVFGDIMIMQMPEAMVLIPPDGNGRFPYLMQFMDGNRIDLTLLPIEQADERLYEDSLSVLLLDKDGVIAPFAPPSEASYLVKPPTSEMFANCCNEFYWVSTYVAKGLYRKEMISTQYLLEDPVRSMLNQMVKWHIGVRTLFSVNIGASGKYIERYLEEDLWQELLQTYARADYDEMWEALLRMNRLFQELAAGVADHLDFEVNQAEAERVYCHLEHVRSMSLGGRDVY